MPIIIYEWHVKTGSHLKIQATLDQILAEGYKWMEFMVMSEIFGLNVRYDK